jgi:hypothetical protein
MKNTDLGSVHFYGRPASNKRKLAERILFRSQDATKVELAKMNFVVKIKGIVI